MEPISARANSLGERANKVARHARAWPIVSRLARCGARRGEARRSEAGRGEARLAIQRSHRSEGTKGAEGEQEEQKPGSSREGRTRACTRALGVYRVSRDRENNEHD